MYTIPRTRLEDSMWTEITSKFAHELRQNITNTTLTCYFRSLFQLKKGKYKK